MRHAPSWPEDERRALAQRLAARGAARIEFVADASIDVGFRVHAGPNMLDATLEGLLAEQRAIQGRLLQELTKEPRS